MAFIKEYINRNGQEYECSLNYDLGGYGRQRGYYIYVTPVTRTIKNGYVAVEYELFFGKKAFLKSVSRQSNKALTEAKVKYYEMRDRLIEVVKEEERV